MAASTGWNDIGGFTRARRDSRAKGYATGIAPLERLIVPPSLSGSHGAHRCQEGSCLGIHDDLDAIGRWIAETSRTDACAAGRHSAAEKLVNWACFERGKAVSSLDEIDFADFARFLADPTPAELWICRRGVKRGADGWRPFTSALSLNSRRTTMHHLCSMARWMARVRYADLRCLSGKRMMDDGIALYASEELGRRIADPEEAISIEEWTQVRRTLDRIYPRESASSHRLIVELMYYGGYYLSDIAKITTASLEAPNRVVPCWTIRRPSNRVHQSPMFFAPPPLSDTLTCWMATRWPAVKGCVYVSYNTAAMSLLGMELSRMTQQANQVLRHAARLALEEGGVPLGLRLRDRSVTAFRRAFSIHQRPAGFDPAATRLTGRLSAGAVACLQRAHDLAGREGEEERRPIWDWSHAAHLWYESNVKDDHAGS